ncbi:MAG: response regulator [Hyphomicrobiaceae bacterium]
MRDPALILVVDDNEANVDILLTRLEASGYTVITARDGEEAIHRAHADQPDLILLDVMMPKLDGFEVARRLKADRSLPYMPIIHITAKAETRDVVAGLDAGGDEYLTKPIDHSALLARVRAILRTKALHDTVEAQARELARQSSELADLNRTLAQRVEAQVAELQRLGRLRRFLSPQVADVIVSSDSEHLLASHRREITVVFCDLRGFTAFSEIAEPEEVMGVLAAYHAAAGRLIERHAATLERFAGDGLMLFFNDPLPCPDAAERALRFATELRAEIAGLASGWQERGHALGFGVGIAQGYATLGRVGFEGRGDYAAVGPVVNQASRLCDLAKANEILLSQRVAVAAGSLADLTPLGEVPLKGLRQPIAIHRLNGLNE